MEGAADDSFVLQDHLEGQTQGSPEGLDKGSRMGPGMRSTWLFWVRW